MNLGDKATVDGKSSKSPVQQVLQPAPENRWGVWVTGFGDFVNVDADGNANGYQANNDLMLIYDGEFQILASPEVQEAFSTFLLTLSHSAFVMEIKLAKYQDLGDILKLQWLAYKSEGQI